MIKSCCAYECKEKFIKGGFVSFHRFPKNQERRYIWEKNIRRENFKATNSSLICSKHFTTDCFDTGKFGGTWLKSDAVPTIFKFPQHLQIKTSKRRILNRNNKDISPKPCKRLKYVVDFNEEVLESPTKAKLVVTVATEELSKKSKIIKTLRQKERRMQKRLKTFQEVIDYLKQKAFISNRTQEVLELSMATSDSSAELFKQLQKKQGSYEEEIKSFALTHNFFSSKAYEFVREALSLNLPHPSTLRSWFQ
ncbi:THAP domain-containing protein 2 [Araneus ventricosus]|uniref:THAP domain-containing protein 2 n=1 Tax=Araneus ventricosus TaxID=182803 RepID=A0A4Y2LKF3_ARAVE|nr:THAP domain-containing protein 2 [Araneus ventricosus]